MTGSWNCSTAFICLHKIERILKSKIYKKVNSAIVAVRLKKIYNPNDWKKIKSNNSYHRLHWFNFPFSKPFRFILSASNGQHNFEVRVRKDGFSTIMKSLRKRWFAGICSVGGSFHQIPSSLKKNTLKTLDLKSRSWFAILDTAELIRNKVIFDKWFKLCLFQLFLAFQFFHQINTE